jgi:hypothetical protein
MVCSGIGNDADLERSSKVDIRNVLMRSHYHRWKAREPEAAIHS